jgi:hypothetical protein
MEVIGKKTAKHIQAGDVIGLHGNHIHSSSDPVERLVTVISVEIKDRWNYDNTHVMGKTYEITCSDGNTYEIGSRATKYFIFATEVK